MEPTSGYTVLVVEDDLNHQLLIRRALTDDGSFSVVQFARDSHDAEHFAKQMHFDCLLVDNRIPGRRGLDLIEYLRSEGVKAPFVLMTSVGTEELVVQAFRKHVAEYVIKHSGFWNDVPKILLRVIRERQAERLEEELRERLKRTNERLQQLNTDIQLQNQQLVQAQLDREASDRRLAGVTRAVEQDLAPRLSALAAKAREAADAGPTSAVEALAAIAKDADELALAAESLSRSSASDAAPTES